MSIEKCKDFIKDGYGTWDDTSKPTTYANMHDFMENQNNVTLALANGLWQPGTVYSTGDMVKTPDMGGEKYALCTTAGTTGTDTPSFETKNHGETLTDGTVTWKIITISGMISDAITSAITANNKIHQETDSSKITDWNNAVKSSVTSEDIKSELLKVILPSTAAAHNSIYRGKDLTAYWTSGNMSKAIQAGTFDDIFPGDYVTKSITVNGTTYNVKWIVGDLDYHLGMGDTETTSHHVLMFAESAIFNARMNATNSTSGGFKGSEMFTTTLPKVSSAIKSAFGADHVLNHRELLSKSTSTTVASGAGAGWTGGSTDWEWTSMDASLFNEVMIYGTRVFSSSFFDVGEGNSQIAAFRMNHGLIAGKRTWNWTRAVAYATAFAISSGNGESHGDSASDAGGGVRLYFLAR